MCVEVKGVVIGEGMPKVCVPLTGRGQDVVLLQAQEAVAAGPDLVEWRVDFLRGVLEDIEKAGDVVCAGDGSQMNEWVGRTLFGRTAAALGEILGDVPLLVTFRTADEGGEQEVSAEVYRKLNLCAAACEAVDLVDVEICKGDMSEEELAALIGEIQMNGKVVVASNHHFTETPSDEEMYGVFKRMENAGADIWKVAVMPECPEDVLRLLAVTRKISAGTKHPVITMSMGKLGVISRMAGEVFGSAVTFASVSEASAPGQVEIGKLRQVLQLLSR